MSLAGAVVILALKSHTATVVQSLRQLVIP